MSWLCLLRETRSNVSLPVAVSTPSTHTLVSNTILQ